MGMSTVRCEGYADVKESGFGNGSRTSSDLDGADVLLGAGLLLVGGAIGAMMASIPPAWDENTKPEGPTESANIEYGPYRFNASGENASVHSQYSNRTYLIEFDKIEHTEYTTFVPMFTGKVMMMLPTTDHDYTGHFNVTDMGTMEKTQIALRNVDSAALGGNASVHASVGSGIAELTIIEKYVTPLKE